MSESHVTSSSSSPLHDNIPNSNQPQQEPWTQIPYAPQNATQAPWTQIPYDPQNATQAPWTQIPYDLQNATQAPWTQIPYAPQNATQPPWTHPQQGYSSLPFWSPQPFGANYIPPIFPTFNAPWDPSTYLAMQYQLQQCWEAKVNNSYLSQMHQSQQSWEAQLMENAELWANINKLQAEIFDSKDRLTRLEEEVSSLKHEFERPANEIMRTIPGGTRQPRKRGRWPEQSSSSEEALYESD